MRKQRGADIVAVYGGDDTLTEVATGLGGSSVPLALLPSGTANIVAKELGVLLELSAAASLVGGNTIYDLSIWHG